MDSFAKTTMLVFPINVYVLSIVLPARYRQEVPWRIMVAD